MEPKTINGILYTYELTQDDTPVRGNAMVSGDDETDRECEDEILASLDRGDVHAWGLAKVTASAGGLKGTAYLGGLSHDTEESLWESVCGDYGLEREALADLETQVKAACASLETVKAAVQARS